MNLRPHQQRLLEENPDHALLVHEMRTGKSLIGKHWTEHPRRNKHAVIVCLKQNKQDWIDLCPNATVYTKEEFKKFWTDIKGPTCILVDEAHNFAAPLMIAKKRSALAESMFYFIEKHSGIHVMLLTATPLTNDPASLHTLMAYLGKEWDWKKYQEYFYKLEYKPFLPRPAWFPQKNWRVKANKLLEKHADIVSLADCVDSLPPETHEVIEVKPGKYESDEWEHNWVEEHMAEQENKLPEIKKIGAGYRKVILVCKYTKQIDDLAKKLKNDKPVFVLDGRTKDHAKIKKAAQESSDCYFIVQAKMGMGWDGYMFGCLVFVSMDHRVIDFTQMVGRLTSVDHQKPLVYYYLLAEKKWDKLIYKSVVKDGIDFNIHRLS